MQNFKSIILITLLAFSFNFSQATVYYVNSSQPNNLGNGVSWATAKKDVQDAINLAIAGDSVWIAAGTYLPTDFPPTSTTSLPARAKTFFVSDGVKLYGGFNGTETNFSQRNLITNITILSGDFSNNDIVSGAGSTLVITGNSENAYHVVLAVAPATGGIGVVIDGLNIVGGNANTVFNITINSISIPSNTGGGIFCINGFNTISNDSIIGNSSLDYTAGICLRNSQNIIQYCSVNNNNGQALECRMSNISFSQINNNYLGGIKGNRNNISNSDITNNGILGINSNYYGGIYGDSNKISYNTITLNKGISSGGIRGSLGYDTILNNIIKNNKSHYGGGGISISSGNFNIISNNIIELNTTGTNNYGGGIYLGSGVISNNLIKGNSSSNGGGVYATTANIINNTITGNTCNSISGKGGGIALGSGKIINNCIYLNTAGSSGGGLYIFGNGTDTIVNNTFYKNQASNGGGFYCSMPSSTLVLCNNIFWRNIGTGSTYNGDFYGNSNSTFSNCLVQDSINHYTFTGTGIHDLGIFASNIIYATNPLFVDTINIAGGDGIYGTPDDGLRLKSNSPCVNSGFSGSWIPSTDIVGTLRPVGAGIDIGAYEKIICPAVTMPTDITAVANLNICIGASTTLSVSSVQPANNIQWFADSTTTTVLSFGYNFTTGTLALTDTFWVSANNCDSTSSRIPIVVHVGPEFIIMATPNDTICSGTSVTLTANGANTYIWSGGITNGIAFTPTVSASYTVTATDIYGCTKSSTQNVTVKPSPTINISVVPNDSICGGSNVKLIATGTGVNSWSGGITNNTYFIPTASNTYTVTATATNGCTITNTQLITVNPLPIINISASPDDTICNGTSLTLTSTGGNIYSWSGGITNAIPFTPTASGTYTVTATSSSNCTNTSAQTITVNPSPTISITVSPNDTVCAGTTVTLTATGASTYTWSGGITNAVAFTPTASDTYNVTATASNTCTATSSLSIDVKPIIAPNISISTSITQGLIGDLITYTATTNVPSPNSIDWYRNTILTTTTSNNVWNTAIIAGSNSIYAVIKSADNCLTPDSAKSNTLLILNVTRITDVVPEEFSIYPNPSSDYLTLKGLRKNDKLKMYNAAGQLILTETNLDSNNKILYLTSYATGIYTIVFERNGIKWLVKFEKR